MRISTWNVNGIRAAMGKGFKEWMAAESPDVLCLQEIKANHEQLTAEQKDFPGYSVIWNSAERPGYSGVATFYKTEPFEVTLGLDEKRFDVEGRVICTRHPDFTLFNIYFPNGQRSHERLQYKLEFYARLLEVCDNLHKGGENIIITGDFNIAHMPIDLRNPKENVNTSGFMPEERAWVDTYLQHGFVDIYRHLYPERVQYTWWTYRLLARQRNIGWRIDYFLVSEKLVPRVRDVITHDDVLGSDHCPVTLVLD
ncbi:MAG: exodeoxyribonuclease III [Chloroflexi bacterium]|nr:exodeoxyribonuclease III [Chloroflexota bacterium]